MRIGLFGGTFDPVHMGHLLLAETVRSDLPLDKIIFIPAAVPPHKQRRKITASEDRLCMLRLALKKQRHFEISEIELEKGGVSYTIDTVKRARQKVSAGDELFLIIGGDSLSEMPGWKDPLELVRTIPVVVGMRPGYNAEAFRKDLCERAIFIPMPLIDISSTEIRKRVKKGKSIRYWVPSGVEDYIRTRGLYQ